MTRMGEIRIRDFLLKTNGVVTGRMLSDAKNRVYHATYSFSNADQNRILVSKNGSSISVSMPAVIPVDEQLVAFFGLYSGDGAKGSEDPGRPGVLRTGISFSQREPNLVRFAVEQFKRIFPEARFVFSLGEDSAYFMSGTGLDALTEYYGGVLPTLQPLSIVRPTLNLADKRYLEEKRHVQVSAEEDLAFFYQHKDAMKEILIQEKSRDIEAAGIVLDNRDEVTASLRRPYKKGARQPGGSSRSDETHVGGVTGMGELFLKIMHEIEDSVLENLQTSTQGLVCWTNTPDSIGEVVDLHSFFTTHPFGSLAGRRPQRLIEVPHAPYLDGQWRASIPVRVAKLLRITPLWCYTSGLYLAEGSSPKHKMFQMFAQIVSGLCLGFTSSENTSLELVIRALQTLFPSEKCVNTWKIKVGSQYFPELVVVGLKNVVPVLRGGNSGDGKLRTMEISLAIKNWALEVTPVMKQYEDKFSHVEPTGAGVPRIDFSASSALCKWYFPLIMYAAFGQSVKDPSKEFSL